MLYGAAAADAPHPGAPTTGIDDAADQPAPFNRPPVSPPPQPPLSAARKAEVAPPEGSHLSILSPQGAIRAPRMIDVAGGAGPANAPEGPDLVSLAEHGMLPRLVSPLYLPPQASAGPAAPQRPAAKDDLSDLDFSRMAGPSGADMPNLGRRLVDAFATGYGDQPIIPTQDSPSVTTVAGVKIPDWARRDVMTLMAIGNTLPQALDLVLRGTRGVANAIPGGLAGAAEDLGIVGHGVPADKLQGELGIVMQFPGEPGAPSLAAAPRIVPETIGQRVLKRNGEPPWVAGPPLEPPQRPPNHPVERFAPRPADFPVDLAALEARVQEIHAGLDPRAQNHRTTAVLATNKKTIVGGGATVDLNSKQIRLLRDGEVPAEFPGEDAEITVLWKAVARGDTPRALATSRPICPKCQAWIEAFGGKLVSPTLAIFPTP